MILTGGRSVRMGRDKAHATIGGAAMVERVVAAIPGAVPIVIVGPAPAVDFARPVVLTREEPPGGGPVAGLAAALPHVATDLLALLATDLPFLGDLPERLVHRLADSGADAVLATDSTGREQPVCAAYRTASLRASVTELGDPDGVAMRRLVRNLHSVRYKPRTTTVDPTMDVDTPADLARARGAVMMQGWIDAVRLDLNMTGELDVDVVLDVAKDVAHNVQRPAAPVTTYLLGLAVGSGMPLHEAADKIRDLASGWIADE